MSDDTPSPNDPAPEYVEVTINVPPAFLEACAAQGLDPALVAQRLVEAGGQSLQDAEQLFDDFADWTPKEVRQWMLSGAAAKIKVNESPGV